MSKYPKDTKTGVAFLHYAKKVVIESPLIFDFQPLISRPKYLTSAFEKPGKITCSTYVKVALILYEDGLGKK